MGRSRAALLAGAVCGILCIAACGRAPQERAGEARSAPSSAPPASATAAAANVEWPFYAGNLAAQRYSPLDQINRDNVGKLEIAWRFQTGNYGPKPESRNEATPLMIGGVLYTTAGVTRNVTAIDPKSGETLWVWRPNDGEERYKAAPRKSSGRGLSYWTDHAGHERLFVVTPGFFLVALDPDTGRPVPGFGENGVVDLMVGVRGEVTSKTSIGNSSPALVIGDVVIVGPAHDVAMRPPSKANLKGDVRGYDVRTGKLLWTFHTIPAKGEKGYETWLDGSAEYTGNAGVWAPMSADPELGFVYLPVEAPLSDRYGGERPGNNLYGNSVVCLDAKTGEVVWYYQLIHHDIWDWDNPTAPVLMNLVVEGKSIRAVAQVTKQAFVYTFDRTNGKPIWPIEERPVGKSDVPGEVTSPTQPFPTKPPAFDRQGFTDDDLIDFTPALRAEALAGTKIFRFGPIFTPPSLGEAPDGTHGTLTLPSAIGGANWEGGAFDPETNTLYIGSFTNPSAMALKSEPDFSDIRYITGGAAELPWVQGLPLAKPPYGRITAIDMNKGEFRWQIPNGPTPKEIAENPALKGVSLPPTGRATRPVVLATKTLLFAAEGWGGAPALRAHDKATGDVLAEIKLPGAVGDVPMTYAIAGKQYIVMSVAGEHGAELVALALP
ncbi:MAG TPA: pyrroloquinoline quinone-dependent dehydrogenase [Gammaproteobacteria bacterium]|nr:pyrroloquinoline quinone-dependent dehydrogenase [Gammaproteobacteria bacterium]